MLNTPGVAVCADCQQAGHVALYCPMGGRAGGTEPRPDFSGVPSLIREHGRSRGFERLRDIVLDNPTAMGGDSLLPVLKLVIELDRHALFSGVSEAKAREHLDKDAWDKFQEYLRGDDVTVSPEKPKRGKKREHVLQAEPGGKKRGKGKQKAERAPLREPEGVLGLLRGTDSAGTGHPGPDGSRPESGRRVEEVTR